MNLYFLDHRDVSGIFNVRHRPRADLQRGRRGNHQCGAGHGETLALQELRSTAGSSSTSRSRRGSKDKYQSYHRRRTSRACAASGYPRSSSSARASSGVALPTCGALQQT